MAECVRELVPHAHAVIVEHLTARPGESAQSGWTLGRAAGRVAEIVDSSGAPWIYVRPQRWKLGIRRSFDVFHEEFDSRLLAFRICPPAYQSLFRRVKDHNTGDAFLMAYWLWTNIEKEPKSDGMRLCRGPLPPFEEIRRRSQTRPKVPRIRH